MYMDQFVAKIKLYINTLISATDVLQKWNKLFEFNNYFSFSETLSKFTLNKFACLISPFAVAIL
jgi:hypothetical protein